MKLKLLIVAIFFLLITGCTQETQNKLSRSIQNWTGTNGTLEIYSGGKVMKRFMKIDKMTTASGTNDNKVRSYRFGYGIEDKNLNGKIDANEKAKVYFEISNFTNICFQENK